DRIAAVEQHAFVAVDVGDLGLAARRRGEARVVGEHAAIAIELGDIDHLRTDGAVVDGEIPVLVADGNGARGFLAVRFGVHGRTLNLEARAAIKPLEAGAETPGMASGVPANCGVAYPYVHCKIA